MATPNNLVVRITAVDATSQTIDAVARRLSGITAPAKKVANSLGRLSDASGVTRLSKAVLHLGGSAVRAGERMTSALGPLGALTAALSVGGMAKMTSDWAKFSQGLGFDAARIGSSVTQLHALQGAATLAGSSAESMTGGLRNLQDTMVDAVGGRDNEALVYFRQLGVAFDDGAGHALRATAILPKLADAIKGLNDPTIQARVATKYFGGAAESLLPFLKRGSAGIAELTEMAKHYGVNTDQSTDKADAFRYAQGRLTLAFMGLGNSISENVSPPLSKLMTFMAELVGRNRAMIGDKFGAWAKQLGDWISSVDWEKTGKYFGDMFDRFEKWTTAMSSFTVPSWMKWLFNIDQEPALPAPTSTAQALERYTGIKLPGSGQSKPASSPEVGQRMMGYFEGQGWTHAQAAGIIANLDRESGLTADREGDFDKNGKNPQAYGLGQWHPDRQANFAKWAGHDIKGSTLDEQMKFVQYELTHGEKAAGDVLHTAPNAALSGYVVNSEYERPKDIPGQNTLRGQDAEKWAAMPAIKVDVNIKGLPPGASAVATSSGGASGGVKIERSMP
jgi:Phage tail lysozyme